MTLITITAQQTVVISLSCDNSHARTNQRANTCKNVTQIHLPKDYSTFHLAVPRASTTDSLQTLFCKATREHLFMSTPTWSPSPSCSSPVCQGLTGNYDLERVIRKQACSRRPYKQALPEEYCDAVSTIMVMGTGYQNFSTFRTRLVGGIPLTQGG